jgi:hypothetical protein
VVTAGKVANRAGKVATVGHLGGDRKSFTIND